MGSTNGSLGGGAIEREAKKKSRAPVEIADDIWLETLRSLSFRQCSKVRFVSRQLNGVAQRNVSMLPCAIIDSATTRLMERNNILSNIIVLDSTIPATEAIQWFKDRDIALDIPEDIQLNNAFIGINLNKKKKNRCLDITVLGSAQQKNLSLQDQGFQKEVVFYAEFRPKQNENSWASMAHFLELLYHPVTYVKELSMYSLDAKLKDTLFAGEERYIRCGLFTFERPTDDGNFRKPLSWLEKNVRAETIDFSNVIEMIELIDQEELSNFFFDASWKCAKQEVKLGEFVFGKVEYFLNGLVEKFRTVVSLPTTFPAIVFSGRQELDDDHSMKAPISGTDVIEERNNDSGGIVYVVSNGQNRMRVEFSRKYPNDDRGLTQSLACGRDDGRFYTKRQYNIRVEVYAV